MNNKIRAFICIDFPHEVVKEVERIQKLIKKIPFTGKLTEHDNLHLTLKFLGEIDLPILDNVKIQLSNIKFSHFQAKLQNIGSFSYRGSPRIAWIKIGSKEIFDLQKEIDNSLSSIFPKEKRFMSHLTIARIKYVRDKQTFKEHINKISVKPISFPISTFQLKSSELKPLGPTYTTLQEYELT